MNFLDIVIIGAIGFGAWKGFSKGLVIEVFSFVAFFLGLWAGIHFSDGVAAFLKESLTIKSEYLPAISFTVPCPSPHFAGVLDDFLQSVLLAENAKLLRIDHGC